MPTVIEQPGESSLHFPPVLHHLEPLAGVFDYLQINLVRLFETAHPVPQPLRVIDAIDPDLAYTLDPRGEIALQQQHQAKPIICVGGGDDHRHDEPERVNEDMPFAPLDFLVPIEADVLPLRCGP